MQPLFQQYGLSHRWLRCSTLQTFKPASNHVAAKRPARTAVRAYRFHTIGRNTSCALWFPLASPAHFSQKQCYKSALTSVDRQMKLGQHRQQVWLWMCDLDNQSLLHLSGYLPIFPVRSAQTFCSYSGRSPLPIFIFRLGVCSALRLQAEQARSNCKPKGFVHFLDFAWLSSQFANIVDLKCFCATPLRPQHKWKQIGKHNHDWAQNNPCIYFVSWSMRSLQIGKPIAGDILCLTCKQPRAWKVRNMTAYLDTGRTCVHTVPSTHLISVCPHPR